MTKRGRQAASLAAVLLVSAMAAPARSTSGQPSLPSAGAEDTPDPAPANVGRAACAGCHAEQALAWTGSHHDLAMDLASDATVLGDFDRITFTHDGRTSSFSRKDGIYYVRTEGADGELHDYRIDYVFGVDPLQQYLVAFPGGRYQVLALAWDTRPAEAGGQRWFHLYPDESVPAGDPLHWTGRSQNWNTQCAECHSTDLRKNYDPASDSFATTWFEIDVSCEACHGPGSRHLAWAKAGQPAPEAGAGAKGLVVQFDAGRDGAWRFGGKASTARWQGPPRTSSQLEACAPCHSRRRAIVAEPQPGQSFLDAYMPVLLEPPLYHPDGQIRDEVYVYGSFLQSPMHRAGVVCSDCHDPHSLQLRAEGNAVCTACHRAASFDTSKHHRHVPGSEGASCVECHAPETSYMVVDPRRDHSFRIPRPDLSARLGTPDACTRCHEGRSAAWAAGIVATWRGPDKPPRPHFGQAIHAGLQGQRAAGTALAAVITDTAQPAIGRANALALLPRHPGPMAFEAYRVGLADTDPLVRLAAVRALEPFAPQLRLAAAGHLLSDPVRAVRIEAARGLAAVPPRLMSPKQGLALEAAAQELIEAETAAAERPESQLNLGSFYAERGQWSKSEAAYRQALRLDPSFVAATVNLADLYRIMGRDEEGEELLRAAIATGRETAAAHHALGLLLVRRGQLPAGLRSLGRAAELGPQTPRYAYVYAVALNSAGEAAHAIDVLRKTYERHPTDREILYALATFHRDAGERAAAARYADELVKLFSWDAQARQLARELGLAVD